MYPPVTYLQTDLDKIEAFLQTYNFGILVSQGNSTPLATHLPFEIIRDQNNFLLQAHLAKANPAYKQIMPEIEVLTIFNGPHTYISATWYNHLNAPTWNYTAAYLTGKLRWMTEEETVNLLAKQILQYEKRISNYTMQDLTPELLARYLPHVVGFEIKINHLEIIYKLSQDKNEESYCNVIVELEKSQDQNAKKIAELMKKERNL